MAKATKEVAKEKTIETRRGRKKRQIH